VFSARALLTATLVVGALGVGACSSGNGGGGATQAAAASATGPVTLRIGDQNNAVKTLFDASGAATGASYKIEWDGFTDGPHMNAAFSANRIDAGYMGDTPAIFAAAAKAGVRVIATAKATQQTSGYYQFLTRPGSGINSLADLKGKRLAATRSTALEGYLLEVLHTVHLTAKDFTLVDVPLTTLTSTLVSGGADAAISYEPATTAYLAKTPGAKQLAVPEIPIFSVELASQKSLGDRAKRVALIDFVGRLAKAESWRQANPDKWIDAYYVGLLHAPAAVGQKIFQTVGRYHYVAVTGSGLESHLEDQQELFEAGGELPRGAYIATLFDEQDNRDFDAAIAGGKS